MILHLTFAYLCLIGPRRHLLSISKLQTTTTLASREFRSRLKRPTMNLWSVPFNSHLQQLIMATFSSQTISLLLKQQAEKCSADSHPWDYLLWVMQFRRLALSRSLTPVCKRNSSQHTQLRISRQAGLTVCKRASLLYSLREAAVAQIKKRVGFLRHVAVLTEEFVRSGTVRTSHAVAITLSGGQQIQSCWILHAFSQFLL